MPVSAGTLSPLGIVSELSSLAFWRENFPLPPPQEGGRMAPFSQTLDPQTMNDDLFCHLLLIGSRSAPITWTLPPFLVPPFLPVSLRLQRGLQI